MRAFVDPGGADRQIAGLAARQYGVVTRAQLVAGGLSRGAIAHRVAAGRLYRLHSGVYAVGHPAPRPETRWLAAVLACGEGALLSHRSAAALWRIRAGEGPRPDVTVPTRNGRRHPGIVVHRSRLAPLDHADHVGIPVTSPARTLVDLAHEIDHDDLVRALREAQFLRRFDPEAIKEVLERRACRALRRLVEDLILTQSHLEDRLLELCDIHGLPRPLTQQPLAGHRVDFLWPRQRVVVETDGWEAHGTRAAFQADRATANALQLQGYRILRFTAADLKRRPTRVVRQIRTALDAASTA